MPRFVTVGKQTCAGRRGFSLSYPLVNFLTYCFDTSPSLLKVQPSISDKKYRVSSGMMRLSPYSAAGSGEFTGTVSFGLLLLTVIYRVRLIWASALDCHLQGPSHLGSTLLTAIYRVRVKWVCSAVGSFTGSVSFEFLLRKVRKMCVFILTVL